MSAVTAEYEAARVAYHKAAGRLADAIPPVVIEHVAGVLPGAHTIKCHGDGEGPEFTDRLRIRSVLDKDGNVLYDADEGADDLVQSIIDEADVEFLDWLIEIQHDDWWGDQEISIEGD